MIQGVIEVASDPMIEPPTFREFGDNYIIEFSLLSSDSTIASEIKQCSHIIRNFHQEAERLLKAQLRSNSVVMQFDFPEEVRVPCEQYLLYFIEFLKDLGVDATGELQHEAGQVLFAVTPTNATDALDKIRIALEVFLKLPSGSINDSSSMSEGIEIQRLTANIYHLRGQLSLAAALIKAKDTTIEAQELIIGQQRLLLNGAVVLDAMKAVNIPVKETDREEVIKDILAITELKGNGYNLNLAELFRRLKRFILLK